MKREEQAVRRSDVGGRNRLEVLTRSANVSLRGMAKALKALKKQRLVVKRWRHLFEAYSLFVHLTPVPAGCYLNDNLVY